MSNTLDLKIQGAPNGLRPCIFAGMSGKVQAILGTVCINVAKKFGACLLLVTANSETGDTAVLVADRELRYPLRFQRAELTHCIENPEQRRAKVLLAPLAAALHAFKDHIEILLAPQ